MLSATVEAARGGDLDAFGRLVGRFQDMAYGYALARLRDPALAQDAAQEAFTDAFRLLHQLREPAAFPGWLRRIVHKHCDRLVRGASPAAVPLEEVGLRLDAVEAVDAAEALDARRLGERLRRAVGALPERQRVATALYYIGGYTQSEIGAFLELPVSAVKKRIHDARARMRRQTEAAMRDDLAGIRPSHDARFSRTVQLFLALRAGRVERVEALLDADPELVRAEESWDPAEARRHGLPVPRRGTPLLRAAEQGELSVVKLLLARGAAVDARCACAGAETPLFAATVTDQTGVVAELLAAGADPEARAFAGHAPLHVAAIRGLPATAGALLRHGACAGARDARGRTPLHWAAEGGHDAVAEFLLARGAPVQVEDADGRAPAACARLSGHTELSARIEARARGGRAAPDAEGERGAGPARGALADRADREDREGGLFETGIKVVDLLAPLARGARVLLESGPGLGAVVLVGEWIHRISRDGGAAVWAGTERHGHERAEVATGLRELAVRDVTELVWSARGAPHATEIGVVAEAVARAEALRDADGGRDVLLVVPAAPPLRAELEAHYPRLGAAALGSITTLLLDLDREGAPPAEGRLPEPVGARLAFDAARAARGLWPAVHPLSTSRALHAACVGETHVRIARAARALLMKLRALHPDLDPGGGPERDVARARRLELFLTQPFFTTEPFTGRSGEHVPRAETLRGADTILSGGADDVPETELAFRGAMPAR